MLCSLCCCCLLLLPAVGLTESIASHLDYSAIVLRYICVLMPKRLLGLLLSKGGREIFNVRNDHSACRAREGETGTDESALHKSWKH